jgi:hypothetical protein
MTNNEKVAREYDENAVSLIDKSIGEFNVDIAADLAHRANVNMEAADFLRRVDRELNTLLKTTPC